MPTDVSVRIAAVDVVPGAEPESARIEGDEEPELWANSGRRDAPLSDAFFCPFMKRRVSITRVDGGG